MLSLQVFLSSLFTEFLLDFSDATANHFLLVLACSDPDFTSVNACTKGRSLLMTDFVLHPGHAPQLRKQQAGYQSLLQSCRFLGPSVLKHVWTISRCEFIDFQAVNDQILSRKISIV